MGTPYDPKYCGSMNEVSTEFLRHANIRQELSGGAIISIERPRQNSQV
jgi:hypothetical protein